MSRRDVVRPAPRRAHDGVVVHGAADRPRRPPPPVTAAANRTTIAAATIATSVAATVATARDAAAVAAVAADVATAASLAPSHAWWRIPVRGLVCMHSIMVHLWGRAYHVRG